MLKGADLASASLQLDLAVIGACCVLLIVAATATLRRALMRALDAIAPATGRRFDLKIVTAESASRARRRPTVELYYGVHGGTPEIVVADHLPSLVVEF